MLPEFLLAFALDLLLVLLYERSTPKINAILPINNAFNVVVIYKVKLK